LPFEIEANGRVRRVTVTRAGDGFAVDVDGRLHHVDAARIGGHTVSLIVDNTWQRDTVITPDGGGGFVILAGGVPVPVRMNGRRVGARRDAAAAGSGPVRVTAPMPGKIVRVLVKAGDVVHSRQPVVVVEAMKMENELRAERDGTITEVHAREGMSVDAGTLLIVIQ
jgi:acetyl/propionyl-CoA carboxylase alpha subunit